jgi:hypothetical protein
MDAKLLGTTKVKNKRFVGMPIPFSQSKKLVNGAALIP